MECTCDLRPASETVTQLSDLLRFEIKLVKCPLCKAAPELLDACKLALDMPAPIDRRIVERRLKAAIRKAEAQS